MSELQYDIIDKYLKNELTEEQSLVFEQQVNADPELKQELEIHRVVHESIVEQNLEKLRLRLDMIDPSELIQTNFWSKAIGFGAALIGVLLIFEGTMNQPNLTDQLKEADPDIILPSKNRETIDAVIERSTDIELVEQVDRTKEDVISQSVKEIAETKEKVELPVIVAKPRRLENSHRSTAPEMRINHNEVHLPSIVTHIKSCEEEKNMLSLNYETPCVNESNGAIRISGVDIDQVSNEYLGIQNTGEFTDISSGLYDFRITTKSGCELVSQVNLLSSYCLNEESFSPRDGEKWTVPTFDKKGEISIYNQKGEVLFSQDFDRGEILMWNGVDQNGDFVNRGEYVYKLEFSDGEKASSRISVLY